MEIPSPGNGTRTEDGDGTGDATVDSAVAGNI